MEIEVVEVYPIDRDKNKDILTGTLRVKLTDLGIDILGIYFSKRKDCWFFVLPGKKAIHHQTGLPVRYPFIVFEDQEKQRELMDAIRKQGCAFIQKRMADKANPLIFPQKKELSSQAKSGQKKSEIAPASQESRFLGHPKQKVFSDPPPRKVFTKNSRRVRI